VYSHKSRLFKNISTIRFTCLKHTIIVELQLPVDSSLYTDMNLREKVKFVLIRFTATKSQQA